MKLFDTKKAFQAAVMAGEPVYDLVINEESNHPMETSVAGLMKLLDDNKNTEYGLKYGFADIKTVEEYQRRVPVVTYDNIAPEIERMAAGEKNVLTVYEVHHMNETSGAIGAMKMIPMTTEQTQMFVKYNRLYTDGLMSRKLDPKWMEGRGFCTTEGTHRRLPSGITVGSASSKMVDYLGGKNAADKMLRTMYTSPIDATSPEPGVDAKYIHARFFLEDRDVTGIVCGFFSLAAFYLRYIADNYQLLIEDIENGTINPSIDMIPEVKERLLTILSPNPSRARELREIFKNGSDIPYIPMVWPSLSYICGVGADGFSNFDKAITERYGGGNLARIYSGVTASEGLFSVPVDINNPNSLLVAGSGFIEFLPVEAENDFSQIVTMDRLEVGKTYEIICTNMAGFYRYRMSDAVMCTGYFNKTPLVQFMYRVNRTVNLVCEKTTEKMLSTAVDTSMEELGIKLRGYSMYPNGDVCPVRYEFLLETEDGRVPDISEETISHVIQKNMCHFSKEYEECVGQDQTMDFPAIWWLEPKTNDRFMDYMIARGKSPNQLKPIYVITNELQRSFYYKFTVNDSGMTKEKALDTIGLQRQNIISLSDSIWDNPEKGGHEKFASDTICTYLEGLGFAVERNTAGLPTAFTATYGEGTPHIGILAEYDAVDTMSQKDGVFEQIPVKKGAPGHICGQNLVSGGAVGAALIIRNYLEAYPFRGKVTLIGCPDSEINGAKINMARDGVFDDFDLILGWRPQDMNITPFCTAAARQDTLYTFEGDTSPAVTQFRVFRNALDACELMNAGAQYLKAETNHFGWISYSFADTGGDTNSFLRAKAQLHYCVRSLKPENLGWLVNWVEDMSKGAALMTHTTVTSKVIGRCSGFITNEFVCRTLYSNFEKAGPVKFSEDDIELANKIREVSSCDSKALTEFISMVENKEKRNELLSKVDDSPLFGGIIPPTGAELNFPLSLDTGDVSRICPTALFFVGAWPIGISNYTWQAASLGKSGIAHKGLLKAAVILGATAIDFIENPALIENAWKSHCERTGIHKRR